MREVAIGGESNGGFHVDVDESEAQFRRVPLNANLTTVVKLGGSLLNRPTIEVEFVNWIKHLPCKPTLIVVGGGQRVDDLRELDRANTLDPGDVHWKAIEIMDEHSQMVSRWFAEGDQSHKDLNCVDDLENFRMMDVDHRSRAAHVYVLRPLAWLRRFDRSWLSTILPESWSVTSDSIAAFVAQTISAEELILLKSRSCESRDPQQWQQQGMVDQHFCQIDLGKTTVRIETIFGH